MNLRHDQWKLIFTAVRRYQTDKCIHDTADYWECSNILDEIWDLAYSETYLKSESSDD